MTTTPARIAAFDPRYNHDTALDALACSAANAVERHHLRLDLGGLAVGGIRARRALKGDHGLAAADHLRNDLVPDAMEMALWRSETADCVLVCHTDPRP